MIEVNQLYQFEVRNCQRDFRPREQEIFLLQVELEESEWSYLGCFPTDAIGAIRLTFDESPVDISVSFDSFKRVHRAPQAGEIFLIEMKLLSQSDWLKLEAMPRFTLSTAAIVWTFWGNCPKKAANSPAKVSPVPPVAIPGLPKGF